MLAIYKKEMRAYFTSIIGWLFLAFFLAFVGIYMYTYNFRIGYSYIGYVLGDITFIFSILVPLITMRSMAEERRQKTDQLLLTSPVPVWKIVAGKYLCLITIVAMGMAVLCVYPLVIARFGMVNFAMSYNAIFGLFLVGCAYIAIGLFISSITESQAFAAVMTFIAVMITCWIDAIAYTIPPTANAAWITYSVILGLLAVWMWRGMKNTAVAVAVFAIGEVVLTAVYLLKGASLENTVYKVLSPLAITNVYQTALDGVINLELPVYYLSIAFVFCYLTYQSIRKRRYN